MIAAVSLMDGETLTGAALDRALDRLASHERPTAVRVVDEIPTTEWHRPLPGVLAVQRLAVSTGRRPVFVRDPGTERYGPLTRRRLAALCADEPPTTGRARAAVAAGGGVS
jgi:hypothetical protein